VCAIGVLASMVVLARSRTAALTSTTAAGCDLFVAGAPIEDGARARQAIPVSSAGTLVASGIDPAGTAQAEIHATLAPELPERATWNVRRRSFDPSRHDFEVAVRMPEVTGYGVGLMLVTVVTANCTGSAWIDIGDRPPVFTAMGLVGLVLVAAGAVAVVVNLWRSGTAGGATFPGALGSGVPYGAGVGILAQQAGATPLSPAALAAWVAFGSAGAAGLHLGRRMLTLWRRDRRAQHLQSGSRDER
jgi:hypothetical protein